MRTAKELVDKLSEVEKFLQNVNNGSDSLRVKLLTKLYCDSIIETLQYVVGMKDDFNIGEKIDLVKKIEEKFSSERMEKVLSSENQLKVDSRFKADVESAEKEIEDFINNN